MSQVNTLLNQRLKKTDHSSKMAAMAKQTANGNLSSFSGIFSVTELGENEKIELEQLLQNYAVNLEDISNDLKALISITSEVKAINNQAAILHGERIKKAHAILTRYREGAFTAWLITTYGNRQTPYNLMQYYEFYESMPKTLRIRLETMPRQAIYALASREGPLEKKQKIVEDYKGETKIELLSLIRETFPLKDKDARKQNFGEITLLTLQRLYYQLQNKRLSLGKIQKAEILELLSNIKNLITPGRI